MKRNTVFKRVVAYIIDFLVISIISSGITYISIINPKYEDYQNLREQYDEILASYYNGDIEIGELTSKTREMSYDMNKAGYVYIIGDIVVTVIYFAGFACITKGQTLGKKIMGIKIVASKDKDLNILNYIIRTIILNGIIVNVVTLIAIGFTRNTYYKIYDLGSNFDTILLIIIFLMVLFNNEERGLHDVLAGTKVIDIKNNNQEIEEEKREENEKEIKTKKKKEDEKDE